MESRRVYRGIEEAALLGRFEDGGYPHSIVSSALRQAYREIRDAMDYGYAVASAKASVCGNDQLDAEKGFDNVLEMLRSTYDILPYRRAMPSRNGTVADASASGQGASGTGDDLVDIYVRMREILDGGDGTSNS